MFKGVVSRQADVESTDIGSIVWTAEKDTSRPSDYTDWLVFGQAVSTRGGYERQRRWVWRTRLSLGEETGMISLRTNSAALVALRNMNQTQVRLEENLQRLSSGLRLNSAADDPAGIGMSVKFEARIRSLGQAERNAQDGQNLLETAGGGLTEISGLLSKIRELAVEASDATVSTSDRADLNLEFNELREEIDRLAENMEYNDISLLNGSASTLTLHVGADGGASDQLRIGISDTRVAALSGLSIASFSSAGAASSAISSIDGAIDIVNTTQASVGSSLNRLDASLGALGTERDNLIAANSQIRDADLAVEASEFARNQVLMDAGLAVLAQANAMGSRVVGLIG